MLQQMGDGWYWKVPARQVFCETFGSWIKQVIWCHIVLRWFQPELGGIREAAIDGHMNPSQEIW